jgi:peptide chain release factor 3
MQILGDAPTHDDMKSGRVTPMFFGSAFNKFGVDIFLQSFISMAVAPGPAIARTPTQGLITAGMGP